MPNQGTSCGSGRGTSWVASMPTTWRVLDRVTEENLPTVRAARAQARAAAWAAGASPDLDAGLCLDFDATITIAHSEKENAAATWKKTFGFHPLLCFLDRRDVAGGEALAGLLRKGNAGSNTAADHIVVLDMALDALPEHACPVPGEEPGSWTGPRVLARSDSAGATHAFAQACVDRGVEFSFAIPCGHPGSADRGGHPRGLLAPRAADRSGRRDRPARRRLGRRGHRHDRPRRMASRVASGAAQGTTPPRRAADFHRCRRHAHHRDPDQHPHRCRPRAGRRAGTTAPSARPRRGPHPRGEGDRAPELPMPSLEREQRLARSCPDRGRPDVLDQTDRVRRRPRTRPLRDRHIPLPRPARRSPTYTRRTPGPPQDRQDLALGGPDRRGLPPTTSRVHLTTSGSRRRPRNPGEPPPRSATGALQQPLPQCRPIQPQERPITPAQRPPRETPGLTAS